MINRKIVWALAGILVLSIVVAGVHALTTKQEVFANKLLGDKLTEEQFAEINIYTNDLNNVPMEEKWKAFLEIVNGKRELLISPVDEKVKVKESKNKYDDREVLEGDVEKDDAMLIIENFAKIINFSIQKEIIAQDLNF